MSKLKVLAFIAMFLVVAPVVLWLLGSDVECLTLHGVVPPEDCHRFGSLRLSLFDVGVALSAGIVMGLMAGSIVRDPPP